MERTLCIHVPIMIIKPISYTFFEEYYSEAQKKSLQRKVKVYSGLDQSVLFHKGSMQIDVDGSPRAYFPKNANPLRLDDVSSADGESGSTTYVQGQTYNINGKKITATGPRPGFFVSATALQYDPSIMWNCDNFVDAEAVSYFIFPVHRFGMRLGDAGVIIHIPTWKWTPAIFADTNNATRVSEVSLKAAINLDRAKIDPTTELVDKNGLSAGNGDDDRNYFYLYFPGSNVAAALTTPHWPEGAVRLRGIQCFHNWGGLDMVKECLAQMP